MTTVGNSTPRIPPVPANAFKARARAWAELADSLDLQLSPLGLRAIEALSLRTGDAVIDIGCGSGQSTLQLADRVGASGKAIGVDIEPILLDIARRRAGEVDQVEFIECDAVTLDLPAATIDCVFSRFGVMAFADPVAAFRNFRRIMKSSGRLAFVCWRALADNELDFYPLQAAGLEASTDLTPFSFADPDKVRVTLSAAGFRDIKVQAHDQMVSSGGLDAMIAVLLRVGPLGKIVRENPQMRMAAEPRVRAALAARENQGRVALNAATLVVTARA